MRGDAFCVDKYLRMRKQEAESASAKEMSPKASFSIRRFKLKSTASSKARGSHRRARARKCRAGFKIFYKILLSAETTGRFRTARSWTTVEAKRSFRPGAWRRAVTGRFWASLASMSTLTRAS